MNNASSGTMPQNVKKYVYKGTSMVNVVLMLCQIFYMFIFWKYKANILLYYTYFTTVNFIFACIMLKKRKVKAYIYSTFGGILGMMILSVIFFMKDIIKQKNKSFLSLIYSDNKYRIWL